MEMDLVGESQIGIMMMKEEDRSRRSWQRTFPRLEALQNMRVQPLHQLNQVRWDIESLIEDDDNFRAAVEQDSSRLKGILVKHRAATMPSDDDDDHAHSQDPFSDPGGPRRKRVSGLNSSGDKDSDDEMTARTPDSEVVEHQNKTTNNGTSGIDEEDEEAVHAAPNSEGTARDEDSLADIRALFADGVDEVYDAHTANDEETALLPKAPISDSQQGGLDQDKTAKRALDNGTSRLVNIDEAGDEFLHAGLSPGKTPGEFDSLSDIRGLFPDTDNEGFDPYTEDHERAALLPAILTTSDGQQGVSDPYESLPLFEVRHPGYTSACSAPSGPSASNGQIAPIPLQNIPTTDATNCSPGSSTTTPQPSAVHLITGRMNGADVRIPIYLLEKAYYQDAIREGKLVLDRPSIDLSTTVTTSITVQSSQSSKTISNPPQTPSTSPQIQPPIPTSPPPTKAARLAAFFRVRSSRLFYCCLSNDQPRSQPQSWSFRSHAIS